LRPISVPPSSITGRPSGRLPPSIPASISAPLPKRSALLATATLAVGGAAALALVPAASPAAALRGLHAEVLWTQRSAKVTTGYATVVLSLLGLVLTVRKRSRHLPRLDLARLQVVHGALGAAALLALAAHTGLRAGERLDLLLSIDFLAVAALGGLAAAATALGDPASSQLRRLLATRAHLYLLLPLPVLVALHVLGAYYF
jgi:nitrite reductase (NADH) large subunit